MSSTLTSLFRINVTKLNYLLLAQNTSRWYSRTISDENKFDLVVIGGGSGGLSCAKEAAECGAKVAVLDYVEPSPQGTSWGLGGTCVNVGCIPKKLFHAAALCGETLKDSSEWGWHLEGRPPAHNWSTLSSAIQNHVRSLNWGYRVQLNERDVRYLNARGSFVDPHRVVAVDKNGAETLVYGENIVIAVGGRPHFPDHVKGARQLALSSDDIFWRSTSPGKTLVVGGSYVALETAGFLTGLGLDTSLAVRSIPLRGFDQQMAELVLSHMERNGTRIIRPCEPEVLEQTTDGCVQVTWSGQTEVFDTVVYATGRWPMTSALKLELAGVEVDPSTARVRGGFGEAERTSMPHVYAIGDVLQGGVELTPVAIKAGRLLAQRLFNNSQQQMSYSDIATTVFTPLEYSCVGLSEEAAVEKYGSDNIEVYHAFYQPLEFSIPKRDHQSCYIKVLCERRDDQPVVGIHLTGPSAGEMMQGLAVAFSMGLNYSTLHTTVGIHPTVAEEVVKTHITRRSGRDPTVTGC